MENFMMDCERSQYESEGAPLKKGYLNWKTLRERGFCVTGFPVGISAREVLAVFAPFGSIQSIDVHRNASFVTYDSQVSRDEAMKHHHVYNNVPLALNPQPQHWDLMEGDLDVKDAAPSVPKPANYVTEPQTTIHHEMLLQELLKSQSIEEQIEVLKQHVLAKKVYCDEVQQLICSDIRKNLEKLFIVKELHVFGSMVTGLALKGCDLDVYVNIISNNRKAWLKKKINQDVRKRTQQASKCFYHPDSGFSSVCPILKAKTPIFKVTHNRTGISCDVNCGDPLGYWNSKLIRHYLSMNQRFFDMFVIIKYWAKVAGLVVSSSKFSNYSICILAISFLITLEDSDGKKIVPSVQDLRKRSNTSLASTKVGSWFCGFDETPMQVELPDTPQFSVIGLVKGFFNYVSCIPFETHVVSILSGGLISRHLFEQSCDELPEVFQPYKSHIQKHPGENLSKPEHVMVIHDPFKLNHNLTDRISSQVKIEFISACEELSDYTSAKDESNNVVHYLCQVLQIKKSTKNCVISWRPSTNTQNNTHEEMFKLLCEILRNILLLDVEEVEDYLPHKKIKLTDSDDVHSSEKSLNMNRTLICSGNRRVWDGRKKARKRLKICEQMDTSFENERCISQEISNSDWSLITPSIHFMCHFKADCSSGDFTFEFVDTMEKKNAFVGLTEFLKLKLKTWLKNFSTVPKKEPNEDDCKKTM